MLKYLQLILLFSYFVSKCSGIDEIMGIKIITPKTFMFWPNATVPFFINPNHFDHEQAIAIMTALSTFAFKTCLKFAPVMEHPEEDMHVMVFINPDGTKRCKVQAQGHSNSQPHFVLLGYGCLQSPEIDMIIMRALGFPFEHNRMSRDVYIDVMIENIEPSSIDLYTKDNILPPLLRALPYDVNSVMHFGERDYSKNGHRTILFKNPNTKQKRTSLTALDLRKIEIVYGTECRTRDRQEKKELCQSYPGVARRKREVELGKEPTPNINLRVNREITPPPSLIAETTEQNQTGTVKEIEDRETLKESLKALSIVNETEEILEQVYKLSELALKNAKEKYCNVTSNVGVELEEQDKNKHVNTTDLLGILKVIAEYAKSIINNAERDSTAFCQNADSVDSYQRQCSWDLENKQCRANFRTGSPTRSTVAAVLTRRKRAAADDVATSKSAEVVVEKKRRKKEKKIHKKKAKVVQEKPETEKDDSSPKKYAEDDDVDEPRVTRRYFQGRRYTLQNMEDGAKDWEDASNMSLKKHKKRKPDKEDTEEKTDQVTDNESDKENEQEDKDQTIEVDAKAVKKVPKGGIGESIDKTIENSKEIIDKTIESKETHKTKAKDVENIESESVQKTELKISNNDKEIELVEDLEVETTTHKTKRQKKKADKKKLNVEVEISKEKEVRLEKKAKGKSQVKRAHVNLPKIIKLNKMNEEFYNERRWPDGIVRYVIKRIPEYDLEDLRNRLAEVNSILINKTCVKLHEVDAKEAPGYEAHLVLDTSPDYVTGRVGGKQIFGCEELFQGGQHRQHTAMMVMAMLGFYFEVARHDRDKHIRVHMRHVRPDKLHHFEKLNEEATLDLPYDYKSATHPAWQFWRKIGKTGIATVATYKEQDPDGSVMRALGQNPVLLSEYDLMKINSVYGLECFDSKRATEVKEDEEDPEEALLPIQ